MTKKFTIPPRLPIAPDVERVEVEFDSSGAAINPDIEALQKTETFELINAVLDRFSPYVERKILQLGDEVTGVKGKNGEYVSPQEAVRKLCHGVAIFYCGLQTGLKVQVAEDDPSDDYTKILLSGSLTHVADIIGEKQASVIFRKLQSITAEELAKIEGRSHP